ncbi:uncharacterized protein LOC124492541 isoform X2 [Dermatophagoides farinae]|uniref:uncharacterized protein LOC124492541 isoform X2 n=1 Tax=Dermatophagoides farinae TaxID=6954 RepID=UPI003F5E10AB
MNIRSSLLLLMISTTCIITIVVGQYMPLHLQPQITLVNEMASPSLTITILPRERSPIQLLFQTSLKPSTQTMTNQTLSFMSTLSQPRMIPETTVTKINAIAPTALASNSHSNAKSSNSIPYNNDIIELLINKATDPNSVHDPQPVTNFLKNQSPELHQYHASNGDRVSFLQKLTGGQGYGHQPTTSFLGGSIYFIEQTTGNFPQRYYHYQLQPKTSYLSKSTFSYEPYIQPNSYATFV